MPATLEDILTSHHTGRTIVMGVLNVTPDSFSDGGQFIDPLTAVAHARAMIDEGADVIDIGAESTRPGSQRVSAADQIDRLREVVPALASLAAPISIDTTLAEVAACALDAGAKIVNDVSAGRDDPDMFALAAERSAPIVLMHMLGEPKSMQADPRYDDVVSEVRDFMAERVEAAVSAGIDRKRCILDPGIGFGKRLEHNLALLANIESLVQLGLPVLIGVSRKRFIGELIGQSDPAMRTGGAIAACLACRRQGATIFRTHDVAQLAAALKVDRAIEDASA